MFQDLRFIIRSLIKRPSFAAGTMLVLGLAVGINTAIFSLVNAVLLRPLPVRAPGELGYVYASRERVMAITYASVLSLRDKTRAVFSGLAALSGDSARLRVGDDAVPLHGEAVSANYFDVLGVAPRLGRTFRSSEDSPAGAPVILISASLWKTHFNGDPNVLGRTLKIDSPTAFMSRYGGWREYTIVGVLPEQFRGVGNPWQPASYWVLITQRSVDATAMARVYQRDPLKDRFVLPIGRVKPEVTFESARAAVDVAARDMLQHDAREPLSKTDTYLLLKAPRLSLPFSGAHFFNVPRLAMGLMAVAMILMAIAATNLTGMLLARGVGRRTEMAVRLSLGAARGRLIRHLLAESLLLAAGGTVLGLILARVLVVEAVREIPRQLTGVNGMVLSMDVPLDVRVLAFACVTCFAVALLVGIIPAIASVRVDLLSSLSGSGVVAPRQGRSRTRRLVLVPQIALSPVLLLVTGVMVRSLLRIELARPGYDARHVVVCDIGLPLGTLGTSPSRANADVEKEAAQVRVTFAHILATVTALPGVASAAVTSQSIQGTGLPESSTSVISRADYGTTNTIRGVTQGVVSAGYFATMNIPIVRGRDFDQRDRRPDAATAIVSERLASELWPGKDPIGEDLSAYSADSRYPPRWVEVIGVVGSSTLPLEEYPRPVYYVPIETQSLTASLLLVRGGGNPAELIARVKAAVASTSGGPIVKTAVPLAQAVNDIRYPRRFGAALLGVSGIAGLILAALGLFGLMSYAVAQRIGEIGVRMVLGAQRRDVIRLVLVDGAGVAAGGIGLGAACGFAAIRYASHRIVPLPDIDAWTFILVPLVLIASILLACYLPARRAARVDPLVVLRSA